MIAQVARNQGVEKSLFRGNDRSDQNNMSWKACSGVNDTGLHNMKARNLWSDFFLYHPNDCIIMVELQKDQVFGAARLPFINCLSSLLIKLVKKPTASHKVLLSILMAIHRSGALALCIGHLISWYELY